MRASERTDGAVGSALAVVVLVNTDDVAAAQQQHDRGERDRELKQ